MILRSAASIGLFAAIAVCAAAGAQEPDAELIPDLPIQCPNCVAWNAAHEPFRIYGDTYYVGPAQLTSILIASDEGHILIDGALPQSAPIIAANIRALGFRLADVKLILNTHAHYDHAGGISALARASGAQAAASASGAQALEQGFATEDDPQFGYVSDGTRYEPVPNVRAVADGETLTVGDLAVTAHMTPGHTRGSTTWTWRSCEGERCLDMVYADSLNAVSDETYRFTDHEGVVESFRAGIALVAALPCDVLMSPHPRFFQMEEKLAARAESVDTNPFIDPGACAAYAAAAAAGLDARVAQEESSPP